MYFTGLITAARFARFVHLRRTCTRLSDRLSGLCLKKGGRTLGNGLGSVERNASKNDMNLCAMSGRNHFFDERCSAKFIFMVRDK